MIGRLAVRRSSRLRFGKRIGRTSSDALLGMLVHFRSPLLAAPRQRDSADDITPRDAQSALLIGIRLKANIVVIPIGCFATILVGCASSPHFATLKPAPATTTAPASWPAWDQCLRSHGVSVPAGYDPLTPNGVPKPSASAATQRACAPLEPPPPLPTNAFRQEVAAASRCMVSHGFANTFKFFPGGGGITFGPGIGPATPGFAAAQRDCGRFA